MAVPSEKPAPYREAFHFYADAGWSVIPIIGKYPPPEGWTGAEAGYPSYADMQAWSDGREGERNLAIRLPHDVLGIDVDDYRDKRGGATVAECEEAYDCPLPATWRSTARDDGVSGIRLYRIPTGLSWPGQLPGGGVELIRWDHRYCMCWPSIHPEVAKPYRWITPDGAIAVNRVPLITELPRLPAGWIAGLMRGPELHEPKVELGQSVLDWLTSLLGANEEPCAFTIAQTRPILSALALPSGRHEAVKAPLLNLIRVCEAGHPGIVKAIGEIQTRFVNAVTADGSRTPAAAAAEFKRLATGACQRIQADRTWPAPTGDPCRAGSPLPDGSGAADGTWAPPLAGSTPWQEAGHGQKTPEQLLAERITWLRADRAARKFLAAEEAPPPEEMPEAIDLDALISTPQDPVTERIGGLLPVGGRVLLTASMKAGKTTLIANLIRTLADGVPLLGQFPMAHPLTPGERVVLLDNEMNPPTLARWLGDQRIENRSAVSVIPMLGRTRTFDIRIPEILDYWVARLLELRTAILIIDCLKPILDSLNLDERKDTGLITTPLTELKLRAQISEMILTHHTGHAGERARGDSALRGWPEAEWQLVRLAENGEEPELDARRYFKAYGRDIYVPESEMHFSADDRHLTLIGGNRQEARRGARRQEDVDLGPAVLDAIEADPGTSKNRLAKGLREAGHRVSNLALDRTIEDMISRSEIRREVHSRTDHRLYPLPRNTSPTTSPGFFSLPRASSPTGLPYGAPEGERRSEVNSSYDYPDDPSTE